MVAYTTREPDCGRRRACGVEFPGSTRAAAGRRGAAVDAAAHAWPAARTGRVGRVPGVLPGPHDRSARARAGRRPRHPGPAGRPTDSGLLAALWAHGARLWP